MFSPKTILTEVLRVLTKAYLFILPWQTVWIIEKRYLNGSKWQYGTIQFFLSELFVWVVFLVFFLWSGQNFKMTYQHKKIKFSWTPDRMFVLTVLIFLVYSILSIIWSLDKQIALQHSLYFVEAFLLFFVVYLGPISKKEIVNWLLLGSIAPAILGIAQFTNQMSWSSSWLGLSAYLSSEAGTAIVYGVGRWMRAYGSFSHPNIFGGYLAVVLILLFNFLNNKAIKKFVSKIVLSLVAIILASALFFTFSRSAWSMLILAMVVFIYFGLSHKTLTKNFSVFLLMPIIIFIIGGVVYSPLLKTRWAETENFEATSTQERISGYKEAEKIITKYPWLGTGSGNYTATSFLLNNKRPGWEYQPVHNVFLLFLAEMGMVGVLIFIGVLASFTKFFFTAKPDKNVYLSLFLFLSLTPALVLDHYFLSQYFGLMLIAIYVATTFKHDVHS